MADGLDVMAIRIESEGGVVVGVIVGSQARFAIVGSAGDQRRRIKSIDRLPAGRLESNVGAGCRCGAAAQLVKRRDPEDRFVFWAIAGQLGTLGAFSFEAPAETEFRQHSIVECQTAGKVRDAEREMVNHKCGELRVGHGAWGIASGQLLRRWVTAGSAIPNQVINLLKSVSHSIFGDRRERFSQIEVDPRYCYQPSLRSATVKKSSQGEQRARIARMPPNASTRTGRFQGNHSHALFRWVSAGIHKNSHVSFCQSFCQFRSQLVHSQRVYGRHSPPFHGASDLWPDGVITAQFVSVTDDRDRVAEGLELGGEVAIHCLDRLGR